DRCRSRRRSKDLCAQSRPTVARSRHHWSTLMLPNISTVHMILRAIEASPAYVAAIAFYGLYPILTSFIYIVTAVIYHFRRPLRAPELAEHELPFVSVIIPAYNEENVIERSIEGVLQLDYPTFELVVVNDGSTDRTADRIRRFLYDPRVRLLDKHVNE